MRFILILVSHVDFKIFFPFFLNDILLSLRPKFRDKKINFKIECDDGLKLNSYPGVYAQIITNLLLNSLQHGFYEKEKGTITIKANMDKKLLKIQYSEDGSGISKKDLPHIFEPFYTSDQPQDVFIHTTCGHLINNVNLFNYFFCFI